MSFKVREKKATSDPASRKDNKKRTNKIKIRIVVAAGVINKSVINW
jgi:hypothetical protein